MTLPLLLSEGWASASYSFITQGCVHVCSLGEGRVVPGSTAHIQLGKRGPSQEGSGLQWGNPEPGVKRPELESPDFLA